MEGGGYTSKKITRSTSKRSFCPCLLRFVENKFLYYRCIRIYSLLIFQGIQGIKLIEIVHFQNLSCNFVCITPPPCPKKFAAVQSMRAKIRSFHTCSVAVRLVSTEEPIPFAQSSCNYSFLNPTELTKL